MNTFLHTSVTYQNITKYIYPLLLIRTDCENSRETLNNTETQSNANIVNKIAT